MWLRWEKIPTRSVHCIEIDVHVCKCLMFLLMTEYWVMKSLHEENILNLTLDWDWKNEIFSLWFACLNKGKSRLENYNKKNKSYKPCSVLRRVTNIYLLTNQSQPSFKFLQLSSPTKFGFLARGVYHVPLPLFPVSSSLWHFYT